MRHLTEEQAFKDQGLTRLLIDLIQLDDLGFRERFRKSPVKRIKRKGLLRNVAVVLGNMGNVDAVPYLTNLLSDSEPLIRGHCVWALGEILKEEAIKVLKSSLNDETHPWVLEEMELIKNSFAG
jgi:epoxyqueuosine reductase